MPPKFISAAGKIAKRLEEAIGGDAQQYEVILGDVKGIQGSPAPQCAQQ